MTVEQINNSTGTVLYLHHDQQGSTRLLTGSTGIKEASFTYDAYGNQTGHTGTATTPLGYDAQYTSTDTGLIYMRARVYDPATAQFLNVDPALSVTQEPYAYAGDSPTNLVDPSGLEALPFPVAGPQDLSACADPATAAICAAGGVYAAKELYNAFAGEEAGNDEGEAELQAKEAERESECGKIPTGSKPPHAAYRDLEQEAGLSRGELSDALHKIKRAAGVPNAGNTRIDSDGNV
jgi:RHS repeat-associated protein